jgi:hypothetical protein
VIGDVFYFGDYEFISLDGQLSGICEPGPAFPQHHISIPLADNPGFVHFSSCISYWPFAVTLVLLSAYLILVPSRKRPPTVSHPMREFFRGWRRKVGVVALVMALLLMFGWMRSRVTHDWLQITVGTAHHQFESVGGYLHQRLLFLGDRNGMAIRLFAWGTYLISDDKDYLSPSTDHAVLPYWSITVPLTLLSAYLILWKPRTTKSEGGKP